MDYPVQDGIGDDSFTDLRVPSFRSELGAEDAGRYPEPPLHYFQQVSRLCGVQGKQKPFGFGILKLITF